MWNNVKHSVGGQGKILQENDTMLQTLIHCHLQSMKHFFSLASAIQLAAGNSPNLSVAFDNHSFLVRGVK